MKASSLSFTDISTLSEVTLLNWFSSREIAVILESQTAVGPHSRYTFLATDPLVRFCSENGITTLSTPEGDHHSQENPWVLFEKAYQDFSPAADPALPFGGGWLGYLGYEAYRYLTDMPVPHHYSPLPDIRFGTFATMVVIDRLTGQKTWVHQDNAWGIGHHTTFNEPPPHRVFQVLTQPHPLMSRESYLDTVNAAKGAIAEGQIYQVNMCIPFSCSFAGSPAVLFDRLRQVSPTPYAALINWGCESIISASPEQFLTLRHGRLQTRPIKGTARRLADPIADATQKDRLYHSEKDTAELVMIVDLMRNDLSRVCLPGSVTVPALKTVESFAQVHHLVGTIEGELQPDISLIDVLQATFPCGSITGAPKISAMKHIFNWENRARGPFCGAIGLLGYPTQLNLNVAIRTAYTVDETLYFWAGSGIVADSDAASEYDEILAKAEGMIQALEGFA